MFFVLAWPLDSSRGDAQGIDVAEDEIDEVPKLPPDARLESLDQRLDSLQRAEARRAATGQPDRTRQFGQRMAGQMIGGPAGGLLFGWGLDTLFNTKPLFMIIGLFAGFGVGLRNVYYWTKNTPPASGQHTDER
jgi:ATP synthase protein I